MQTVSVQYRATVEEQQDTYLVQLQSLLGFMEELGYTLNEKYSFERFDMDYNGRSEFDVVSFQTAVNLHNTLWFRQGWKLSNFQHKFFTVDAFTFKQAQAKRIVKVVKLQLNKKKKQLQVQNNMVKFVDPAYEMIWLGV
jgi:hypothetical protein